MCVLLRIDSNPIRSWYRIRVIVPTVSEGTEATPAARSERMQSIWDNPIHTVGSEARPSVYVKLSFLPTLGQDCQ